MTESWTRRRAMLIGLLVGLPVILFGALPAVWGLAGTSTCPRTAQRGPTPATLLASPEAPRSR